MKIPDAFDADDDDAADLDDKDDTQVPATTGSCTGVDTDSISFNASSYVKSIDVAAADVDAGGCVGEQAIGSQ